MYDVLNITNMINSLQTKNFPLLKANGLEGSAQEAVDQLLQEGESQNTLASYRSALRYWAAWHAITQLRVAVHRGSCGAHDCGWPNVGIACRN